MNRFLKFVSAMLTFGLIAAPLVVRAQSSENANRGIPQRQRNGQRVPGRAG